MYLYKQIKMTNVLLTECAHIIRTGKLWESKDQQSEELEPIRACNFTGNSLHHIIKGIIVHPQYIFCIYTLCIYIYIHCVYIYIYTLYVYTVAYLGGACGDGSPPLPPTRKVRTIFWQDTLLKMGFQTYIFCSKVPSKGRKCRFRDPNFKMGFQTYIFCSEVPSKCRKCRFRDPNFVTMASPSLKSWLRHCIYIYIYSIYNLQTRVSLFHSSSV